jgi:hypothetical protein
LASNVPLPFQSSMNGSGSFWSHTPLPFWSVNTSGGVAMSISARVSCERYHSEPAGSTLRTPNSPLAIAPEPPSPPRLAPLVMT